MNDLQEIYNKVRDYIGQTVYRICPKCNDKHNGNCINCAWENSMSNRGCTVYGLWKDGQFSKENSQIIETKLTWDWIPNFIDNLGERTFYTKKEAELYLDNIG